MISRPKLLLALPLAFALFGMAQTANATETMVDQKGLQFAPNAVTIKVGDTLHFLNSDHFKHDVTIENPDGTILDKGLMDVRRQRLWPRIEVVI